MTDCELCSGRDKTSEVPGQSLLWTIQCNPYAHSAECHLSILSPSTNLKKLSPFIVIYSNCTRLFSLLFEWAPRPNPLNCGRWVHSSCHYSLCPILPALYLCLGLTSPCAHQKADLCWVSNSLLYFVYFFTWSWWFIPVPMDSLTSHIIFLLAKFANIPFSDAINLPSGKYYSTQDNVIFDCDKWDGGNGVGKKLQLSELGGCCGTCSRGVCGLINWQNYEFAVNKLRDLQLFSSSADQASPTPPFSLFSWELN